MAITKKEKLDFLTKGKEVKEKFETLFKEEIINNSKEGFGNHVDVKIPLSIDVKSLKKINRSDQETNEHIHWVELKGITGEDGWLYGKSDFFAFELNNYWIIVSKEELQKFIADKCKDKVRVSKPELYKLYQRKDRKDIITLITSYDLCYIKTLQIKK